MSQYVTDKIISIAVIVGLVAMSYILAPALPESRWYALLLAVSVLGYSHYLVGGYYQLASYARRPQRVSLLSTFGVLSILSILVAFAFMLNGQVALLAFVVIGYFMVHGFCNEITLYERQSGGKANRYSIVALTTGLGGLILLGVGHASWLFTPDLEFVSISSSAMATYLQTDPIPIMARVSGLVLLVIAVCAAVAASFTASKNRLAHIGFALLWCCAIPVAIWFYPLHYLLLLVSLLVYHFVVWFLFFWRVFYTTQPRRLRLYVGLHAAVIGVFLILLTDTAMAELVDAYLLNSYTFLTATLVHVTVSFMNEPWFQRWFTERA